MMPIKFECMLTDDNDKALETIRLSYCAKYNIGLTRTEIVNILLKLINKNYKIPLLRDKIYTLLHPPKRTTNKNVRIIKSSALQNKN